MTIDAILEKLPALLQVGALFWAAGVWHQQTKELKQDSEDRKAQHAAFAAELLALAAKQAKCEMWLAEEYGDYRQWRDTVNSHLEIAATPRPPRRRWSDSD